jgi:hypothetical protein
MIDISPFLLAQQQETLRGFPVQFLQEDFFQMDESVLSNIDLAILNEVVGDFPTACMIPRDMLLECSGPEDPLSQSSGIAAHLQLLPINAANHGAANSEPGCNSGPRKTLCRTNPLYLH